MSDSFWLFFQLQVKQWATKHARLRFPLYLNFVIETNLLFCSILFFRTISIFWGISSKYAKINSEIIFKNAIYFKRSKWLLDRNLLRFLYNIILSQILYFQIQSTKNLPNENFNLKGSFKKKKGKTSVLWHSSSIFHSKLNQHTVCR